MEIRDPIHGSLELTPPEVAVLDSAAFQRLRGIKQLGFGEFSFPGAVHNRYIHSLGVSHLAGEAFDRIFQGYGFQKKESRWRLRQAVKLAALLHDVGHGPLSHTTEEVMPPLADLKLSTLKNERPTRQANHEDFTLKFILDSSLGETIRDNFPDMSPLHVACLIDRNLPNTDDFFIDNGLNLRPILTQIVSSELDCDRMDYLVRDSYFCGTSYGRVELHWLIGNLTYHIAKDQVYLAISRRALYTFDDFLISRHHMYLMVYFHHKAIIYDEMLSRYLTSSDCKYRIPANIDEYLAFDDYHLYQHLKSASNPWAQRIAQRRPFRVLYELHETEQNSKPQIVEELLNKSGIDCIHTSSVARLSKYHTSLDPSGLQIYVVDPLNRSEKPYPLEQSTEIFQRYEKHRTIERIYVAPEDFSKAEKLIG